MLRKTPVQLGHRLEYQAVRGVELVSEVEARVEEEEVDLVQEGK